MKDSRLLYTVNDESKVIPVIEYEEGDELIHSVEKPYCGDTTCPCGGKPPTNATESSDQEDEEVVS
jgi:hypothetical protein